MTTGAVDPGFHHTRLEDGLGAPAQGHPMKKEG
jgi:hypothetical protein